MTFFGAPDWGITEPSIDLLANLIQVSIFWQILDPSINLLLFPDPSIDLFSNP